MLACMGLSHSKNTQPGLAAALQREQEDKIRGPL